MFHNFLGGGTGGGGEDQPHPHANQQDTQARQDDSPFGRTFQFNLGGGSGSLTIGTIGGGAGSNMGPFGQMPGQGGFAGGGRAVGSGMFGPFGPVPGAGGDTGGGLDA
jgi:hypothetical protein